MQTYFILSICKPICLWPSRAVHSGTQSATVRISELVAKRYTEASMLVKSDRGKGRSCEDTWHGIVVANNLNMSTVSRSSRVCHKQSIERKVLSQSIL